MTSRIEFGSAAHQNVVQAMRGLSRVVAGAGLERPLLELVKIRVSQLNGCAYCLDMHTKDARAAGESEQRLYLLSAWRETRFYSERERAALAWAEAVTRLEGGQVPDADYEAAREQFTEQELVALTLAVVEINGWNRFAIPFGRDVGSYRPGSLPDARTA